MVMPLAGWLSSEVPVHTLYERTTDLRWVAPDQTRADAAEAEVHAVR